MFVEDKEIDNTRFSRSTNKQSKWENVKQNTMSKSRKVA